MKSQFQDFEYPIVGVEYEPYIYGDAPFLPTFPEVNKPEFIPVSHRKEDTLFRKGNPERPASQTEGGTIVKSSQPPSGFKCVCPGECSLIDLIRSELAEYELLIAKGKGTWPEGNYVRDDIWNSWRTTIYVLSRLLQKIGVETE